MGTIARQASISEHRSYRIRVRSPNPLTWITVFDGERHPITRGVGDVSVRVEPGLFKLRFSNGMECVDRLIAIDEETDDYEFVEAAPPLKSPIPFVDRDATHATQDAVRAFIENFTSASVIGVVVSSIDGELGAADLSIRIGGAEKGARQLSPQVIGVVSERPSTNAAVQVELRKHSRWAFVPPALPNEPAWVFVSIARQASGALRIADLSVTGRPLAPQRELEMLEYARRHLSSANKRRLEAFSDYLAALKFDVDPVLRRFAGALIETPAGNELSPAGARSGNAERFATELLLPDRSIDVPALIHEWRAMVNRTIADPLAIPLGSLADRRSTALRTLGVWAGWDPDREDQSTEIEALDLAVLEIEPWLNRLAQFVLDRAGGTAAALGDEEQLNAVMHRIEHQADLNRIEAWLLRFAVQFSLRTQLSDAAALARIEVDRGDLRGTLIKHSGLPSASLGRRCYWLGKKLRLIAGATKN